MENFSTSFLGEQEKIKDLYGLSYGLIRDHPEVVLVDMKGTIIYKGNPLKTNLEENINDLLEGKSLDREEITLNFFNKEDQKKLYNLLIKDKKLSEYLKGLKYLFLFKSWTCEKNHFWQRNEG